MSTTNVTDTRRIVLRVPYTVAWREGRKAHKRAVSEDIPFDVPVRDPDAMPEALRVSRRSPMSDHDGGLVIASERGQRYPYAPKMQTIIFRNDGASLLRPVMAPGGQDRLGPDDLAALAVLVRRCEAEAERLPDDRSALLEWLHYPTATAEYPHPLSLPDRSTLGAVRVTADGREAAVAAVGRVLEGACVCEGVVWIRTSPPHLSTYLLPDGRVTVAMVEIPGYDSACSPVPGEEPREARGDMSLSTLASTNIWEDVHVDSMTVDVLGHFERHDLKGRNLRDLTSRMRSWTQTMTFRSGSPEVRHAASTIDVVLHRHEWKRCGTEQSFADASAAVAAFVSTVEAEGEVGNEIVGHLLGICRGWSRTALQEERVWLDRERAAVVEADDVASLRF